MQAVECVPVMLVIGLTVLHVIEKYPSLFFYSFEGYKRSGNSTLDFIAPNPWGVKKAQSHDLVLIYMLLQSFSVM